MTISALTALAAQPAQPARTPTAAPAGEPINATEVCDREETTVAFVREMFTRLGEKWTMPVLDRLMEGPLRFTAIMTAVPGSSHRVLTVTLRTLENDGMITRTSYPESPPRVEYEVTALGGRFMSAALQMVVWAQDNRTEVLASRERSLR